MNICRAKIYKFVLVIKEMLMLSEIYSPILYCICVAVSVQMMPVLYLHFTLLDVNINVKFTLTILAI